MRAIVVYLIGDYKMTNVDEQAQGVTPLLFGCAVIREGADDLPGEYDGERKVWTVETSAGVIPIVQAHRDVAQIRTLTEVKAEKPDFDVFAVPELSTKTAVVRESDDQRLVMKAFVNLITTTKIEPEQADR